MTLKFHIKYHLLRIYRSICDIMAELFGGLGNKRLKNQFLTESLKCSKTIYDVLMSWDSELK